MIRLTEKGGPTFHRFENTRLTFDPQLRLSDIGCSRHKPNQTFRLMDVEIIDNEVPFVDGWLGFDRPLDVVDIVLLSAARTGRDGPNPTGGDLEVDDETEGAVADILIFPPFDLAGSQR